MENVQIRSFFMFMTYIEETSYFWVIPLFANALMCLKMNLIHSYLLYGKTIWYLRNVCTLWSLYNLKAIFELCDNPSYNNLQTNHESEVVQNIIWDFESQQLNCIHKLKRPIFDTIIQNYWQKISSNDCALNNRKRNYYVTTKFHISLHPYQWYEMTS